MESIFLLMLSQMSSGKWFQEETYKKWIDKVAKHRKSRRLKPDPEVDLCDAERGFCTGHKEIPRKLMPQIYNTCLLYTSPSPRDGLLSRMPSSA